MYLSKAFVLSWSLLEVMASGTPVLAEANPMMEELIEPGVNGALWQGDPTSLGQGHGRAAEHPRTVARVGQTSPGTTETDLLAEALPG